MVAFLLSKTRKKSIKGRVGKAVSVVEGQGVSFSVATPSTRPLAGLVALLAGRPQNGRANGTAIGEVPSEAASGV